MSALNHEHLKQCHYGLTVITMTMTMSTSSLADAHISIKYIRRKTHKHYANCLFTLALAMDLALALALIGSALVRFTLFYFALLCILNPITILKTNRNIPCDSCSFKIGEELHLPWKPDKWIKWANINCMGGKS